MNLFFVIFFGAFALAGSWFVFYHLGYELGRYLMDRHYSCDVVMPVTLRDIDELVSIWPPSERTHPFTILNPIRWRYFE